MSRVVIVALAFIACASALSLSGPHVNEDMVSKINSQSTSWKASTQQGTTIEGANIQALKNLMGVRPFTKKVLEPRVFSEAELEQTIPTSFDSATKWPQCKTITHIRDQSACGSCWAVAGAEAMSDRYCTGGGPTDLLISAATLMECCWYCGNGCKGGDPATAWSYWVSSGLFSDSCQPYPFPKCEHHIPKNHFPECPKTMYPTPSCNTASCTGNGTKTIYKGASSYSLSGVAAFQRELMAHGPLEVAFDVYADFPAYKSGVYVQTSNQYLGGHAVRLVGWGTLNGVDYWKIANSWNKDWGMDGYFLIKRGVDECGIEDSGAAGLAKLPSQ